MRLYVPRAAALVFTCSLLLLPAAVVFEYTSAESWNERLLYPQLTDEPARHTPLFSHGTYLPPTITRDTTLTPADNPVVLAGPTRIPAGVTLTLAPGTNVYGREFSNLTVDGQLYSEGTTALPVTFASNEQHEGNQQWGGIIFQSGAVGKLAYSTLLQAAPAISCLAGSHVAITHSQLSARSVALYAASPRCTLDTSTLRSTRYGIVAQGNAPYAASTAIFAREQDMLIIPNK